MHIIHSFWSKPMLDINEKISNLSYNHWVNKHMFYYTYALSALLLNKYYSGKVILVTDKFGKKLLIDELQLPYDEVIVELDSLNHFPTQFWALGKIYTYSLQNEPFIHLDYDFLLSKKFEVEFENADLVAYINENDSYRQFAYKDCISNFFINYKLPDNAKHYFENYQSIAFNAGVFGGNKIDIFKDLWTIAEKIINDNSERILNDNLKYPKSKIASMTNVLLEQYIFACIAKDRNLEVICLHQNEFLLPIKSNIWQKEYNLPKYNVQYYPEKHIHMYGEHKSSIDNAIAIEKILKYNFPSNFSHIRNLLEIQKI